LQYGSREQYSALRREEALKALKAVRLRHAEFVRADRNGTGIPDQQLYLHLRQAAFSLYQFARHTPDVLLVPAYERGKTDWCARQTSGRSHCKMSPPGVNRTNIGWPNLEKIRWAEPDRRDGHPFLVALGFAVVTGVAVFIAGVAIDSVMLRETRQILFSDLLTAGVVAVLAFAWARVQASRRQHELRQMQAAAEVNHHVRNALTAVLYSVQIHDNPELVEITRSAAARVDWVLREVYPVTDAVCEESRGGSMK
jgi:hypothetical protein